MIRTTDQSGNPPSGGIVRICLTASVLVFSGWLLASPVASAAGLEAEKELLAQGDYQQAISRLEAVMAQSPQNGEAAAVLLQAWVETGVYRKAVQQGEDFLKRKAEPAVSEEAAEAAYQMGEYERAARLLESVSTPPAEWLKGLLASREGQKAAARSAFERVVSRLTRGPTPTPAEQEVIAAALAELGKFQEANRLYRAASQADPQNASLKVGWGKLLAQKHNPGEAQGLFQEALKSNPNHTGALLGLAELAASRWETQAPDLIKRALQVNPNLAEARVLLARMHLEQENYQEAAEQLAEALKANPRLLEAWSLSAVAAYLQDNTDKVEQDWVPRILQENPSYGKVFADLADFALLRRQYATAVEFYRRAVRTDPDLSEARANLGINLFRLGKEQEARRTLEEAYRQDPFNIWTVNTLRLMDSFSRFDSFETARFAVKLHKKESALLRSYVEELLEKSLATMGEQYRYLPDQKVIFEMYPDHEDFAVRTLGLPGLGALGASFGPVVAMDSPSARARGTFHWASTLWHELAHVITLGLTSNRVPRWFTEGLSVYEETKARPGWGDPMNFGIIQALQQNRLIPLENLNGAFIRPKHPSEVSFAYFQSGLICEFIAEKHGFAKILDLLGSYKNGQSDAAAIQQALGISLAEFDAAFRAYARERTSGFGQAVDLDWAKPGQGKEELQAEVARNPRNFFARLRLAALLQKESQFNEAITHAQAAKELFPLYVEEGNPYRILAEAYESLGQKEKAVAELLLWKERKGRDPETFQKLAASLQELGRTREAIQTLEEVLYISMFEVQIHERLAEWYLESANPRGAVREYEAVLALDPPDKAAAHYRLAMAFRELSENRNARREVLAALEIAPGYRPAQKLLLELSSK